MPRRRRRLALRIAIAPIGAVPRSQRCATIPRIAHAGITTACTASVSLAVSLASAPLPRWHVAGAGGAFLVLGAGCSKGLFRRAPAIVRRHARGSVRRRGGHFGGPVVEFSDRVRVVLQGCVGSVGFDALAGALGHFRRTPQHFHEDSQTTQEGHATHTLRKDHDQRRSRARAVSSSVRSRRKTSLQPEQNSCGASPWRNLTVPFLGAQSLWISVGPKPWIACGSATATNFENLRSCRGLHPHSRTTRRITRPALPGSRASGKHAETGKTEGHRGAEPPSKWRQCRVFPASVRR